MTDSRDEADCPHGFIGAWHCADCLREHVESLSRQLAEAQASEQAWKIIAKQADRWDKLPQSEKEAALHKALEDTFAELIEAQGEVEWGKELLRAARGWLQQHNIPYPDEIDDALSTTVPPRRLENRDDADGLPRCDCGHLFEICNHPNCPLGGGQVGEPR